MSSILSVDGTEFCDDKPVSDGRMMIMDYIQLWISFCTERRTEGVVENCDMFKAS